MCQLLPTCRLRFHMTGIRSKSAGGAPCLASAAGTTARHEQANKTTTRPPSWRHATQGTKRARALSAMSVRSVWMSTPSQGKKFRTLPFFLPFTVFKIAADLAHRLVRAGLLAAIMIAAVAAALTRYIDGFNRACAFSRGFNNGFDRYRCDLVLRVQDGPQFRLPLP
jgi:hypothetical protein